MNRYTVHSDNLNDSLVFYRSLLNRMPDVLAPYRIIFNEPDFELAIEDSQEEEYSMGPFHLNISSQEQLQETYKRMRRFLKRNQLVEDCESLAETIGLTDPNGYKWIVGKYSQEISYEKCYINS